MTFILLGNTFLYASHKEAKRYLINERVLVIIVSLIIMVFIFAHLGSHIGQDTMNYYNFYYLKVADQSTFLEKWENIRGDYLFRLLTVAASFVKSFHFYLFIIAAVFNWF